MGLIKMAVLSGYIKKEEIEEIKRRVDVTSLEQETEENGLGEIFVKLDCDWSIMEFLDNFGDSRK